MSTIFCVQIYPLILAFVFNVAEDTNFPLSKEIFFRLSLICLEIYFHIICICPTTPFIVINCTFFFIYYLKYLSLRNKLIKQLCKQCKQKEVFVIQNAPDNGTIPEMATVIRVNTGTLIPVERSCHKKFSCAI